MAKPAYQLEQFSRAIEERINRFKKNLQKGKTSKKKPKEIHQAFRDDLQSIEARLESLSIDSEAKEALLDSQTRELVDHYRNNAENLIGTVKVPLGIAGPVLAHGLYADGYYLLPLATHEAALVASYHRGALAINEAGGCLTAVLSEGVNRSPGFAFESLAESGPFAIWISKRLEKLKEVAEGTTSHGKLIDLDITVEASNVYLNFVYKTGDASGQNMATLATEAACQYIVENAPQKPRYWFVEANMSGDKKASQLSFLSVRGKKVSTEIRLSAEVLKHSLKTTASSMQDYWRMSAMGSVLSGTIGIQGHYANGLAALYIATGQDAACVSESAVGTTRFEAMDDGSLYAAVTLPNLIVGTVGGGTQLPSQNACLRLMNLQGDDNANALAEVCGALCLAGELSIASAIAEGDFSRAHRVLARTRARSRRTIK